MKCKVKIGKINWPHRCAACDRQPTGFVKTQCQVVTDLGYWLLFFTANSQIVTIKYPACLKHRIIGWFSSKISKRSMLNLAFGVLAVFSVIRLVWFGLDYFGISKNPNAGSRLYFDTIFPVMVFSLYVWGKINAPIRVVDATDSELEMEFKDESFARDFININKAECKK